MAVGDGANDAPMLMESHVGVAIRSAESNQALMSSDFAICQFKFLVNMLFFHGRQTYWKMGSFIRFYFYKNVVFVFADILSQFFNGFSG